MFSEIIVATCRECGEHTHLRLWPERAVCLSCGGSWCRCCNPPVTLPPAGAAPCPAQDFKRALQATYGGRIEEHARYWVAS